MKVETTISSLVQQLTPKGKTPSKVLFDTVGTSNFNIVELSHVCALWLPLIQWCLLQSTTNTKYTSRGELPWNIPGFLPICNFEEGVPGKRQFYVICTAWCQWDFSCFYLWMTFYQDVYLLLFCNSMFYDWSECVMNVPGTTKHSSCNQCVDTWQ